MPMTAAQLKQQQDSAKVYQADYDEKLRRVGMRAPEPVLGQEPDDYRRETLRFLKRTWKPLGAEPRPGMSNPGPGSLPTAPKVAASGLPYKLGAGALF
jgi:hypothetical protein